MATQTDIKLLNERLCDYLDDPHHYKQALDAINDYTRTTMREDGFLPKFMPPLPIQNEDLDRQVDTDNPVKVVDKEPGSPAALSLPFASLPTAFYIRGPRYRVTFARYMTPRAMKDVEQLRTWAMDIRQVISDNMLKDLLAEEDSKFISAFNSALVGQDQVVPLSGVAQWRSISGGITRESVLDALKIMNYTPSRLECAQVLCNFVTIKEIMKWGRDEMGGDLSETIVKDGWGEVELFKRKFVVTIKRDLVPDDNFFMFSEPKFIGKNYELEPVTLYVKREAFMLEWFSYKTCGASFGHLGGLARATFV